MNENACLLKLLKTCCCVCGFKDKDGKTCCGGIYVAEKHGYCQDFLKTEVLL